MSDKRESEAGDSIDRGMAEAFGGDPAPAGAGPSPSVLRALRERTGSRLDLHLDSHGLDDAPVRVTDEAKALRDPAGRYQLLGEIGRGGVGVVYKGRDTDLGRDVAMKVLKDEYAARPDVLARFVEEAQLGGQLQHPGIVPVYELGLSAGERPYFAMKLVKGETLAEQLARRTTPAQDRRRLLGVFEQVCQTIAYAHARRVVHRDLKPANVMIGAFGEVQVVDWGFAKVLAKGGTADEAASVRAASERSVIETVRSAADSGSASLPGSMMGTPAYMPPEQAQGDVAHVDRRSDVFALGAILCEILTGEPPYREADGDLVRQAANAELDGAHERLERCGAAPALVALCTECLAPARRARPESATEVAERVGAWLTSVEERARQAELRAAEARYRARTTRLAAAAVLAVVLLAAGAWTWIQGEARDRRAESARLVATALSDASGARGRAQAAGLDPALWDAALATAEQAAELARSGDVDEATLDEAETLFAAVGSERTAAAAEAARLARDATMLARLETLRIPTDDNLRQGAWQQGESRRLDAEYMRAFAEYLGDVSLVDDPLEASVASLRHGDIDATLVATLDHWALVRERVQGPGSAVDPAVTRRIRAVAEELDPGDSWWTALRALLPTAERQGPALLALAEELTPSAVSVDGYRVLGEALCRSAESEAAVDVLRRGQELYPQDFSLCADLALHLELLAEPRWEEALTTYRIAHALRPEHMAVLHRQGVALERLERHADAERVYRRVLEREPEDPHVLCHLGWTLDAQGRSSDALEVFERALQIDPDWADAHKHLGAVLIERGEVSAGIERYRRAAKTGTRKAVHHYNLGTVLMNAGRYDEAVESLRLAVALDPHYLEAWGNLGNVLSTLDDLEGSRAALERALDHDPTHARTLFNLGNTYRRLHRPREAARCFRQALEVPEDDSRSVPHDDALVNLGNVLTTLAEFDEALVCFGRALELEPNDPTTYHSLGYTLQKVGRFDEAEERYHEALELDPEYGPSLRQLARLEQRPLLEDLLSARAEPGSSRQWAEAVMWGYEQRRHREVVALTARVLESGPGRAAEQTAAVYNSACVAVLFASDAEAVQPDEERARLRGLARTWLGAEVERWAKWREESGTRAGVGRQMLELARQDPNFASVRDDALAELPEAERAAWRKLWQRVEELLAE